MFSTFTDEAPLMSIGDCFLLSAHAALAASSEAQCSGPPAPLYAQWTACGSPTALSSGATRCEQAPATSTAAPSAARGRNRGLRSMRRKIAPSPTMHKALARAQEHRPGGSRAPDDQLDRRLCPGRRRVLPVDDARSDFLRPQASRFDERKYLAKQCSRMGAAREEPDTERV